MTQASGRPGATAPANTATDSHQVESGADHKKRKRSGSRGTARRIQKTARERQAAWLEAGRPNATYRLTRKLDELYDEHREERAGTLTDPFAGRTWRPR